MADTGHEPDFSSNEPQEMEATIAGLYVRLYRTATGLWCAQIGNGFYNWLCTKQAAIDAAEKRVKEIVENQITIDFKNKFRK